MEKFLMLSIIAGLFAIGDILGVATKAKLSSVFVALMGFLILFMTGIIPSDIIGKAQLDKVATLASPILVFHMGSMINTKQLIEEWKTVLMAFIGMVVTCIAVFLVIPIVGKEVAIVSIPVLNGGIVATNIMVNGALEKGFVTAAAFGTFAYAIQKFVGTPPASYFGVKEAKKLIVEFREKKEENISVKVEKTSTETREAKKEWYKKYDKYFTNYVCFGITALFCFLASILSKYTGIGTTIWALILSAFLVYLGVIPPRILDRGKMSGFFSMLTFAQIIPSLAKIKFEDLMVMGYYLLVIFGVTMVGLYIVTQILPLWKLVGSKNLAMGIVVAQLLGFPATYLICNEIATAVAETEEEHEFIMSKLTPAYVVAGLASVTTLSVIVAGEFVKFL